MVKQMQNPRILKKTKQNKTKPNTRHMSTDSSNGKAKAKTEISNH